MEKPKGGAGAVAGRSAVIANEARTMQAGWVLRGRERQVSRLVGCSFSSNRRQHRATDSSLHAQRPPATRHRTQSLKTSLTFSPACLTLPLADPFWP